MCRMLSSSDYLLCWGNYHMVRRARQLQGVTVQRLGSCTYLRSCQVSKHLAFATTNCMHLCFYKLTLPHCFDCSAPLLPNIHVLFSKIIGRFLKSYQEHLQQVPTCLLALVNILASSPESNQAFKSPPYCFGKTSYLVSYRPLPLFIRIPQNAIVSLPEKKKCHCIFVSANTTRSGSLHPKEDTSRQLRLEISNP